MTEAYGESPPRRHRESTWPEQDRRRVVGEVRAALDEHRWDDVGELLDDYFSALSIAAPEVVRDVWARVPRAWLAANPRQQLAAAMTRAADTRSVAIEENVVRSFLRWMLAQERPAVRDVLLMHALDIRQHLALGRFARANDAADDVEKAVRDGDDLTGLDDAMGNIRLQVGLARLNVGDLRGAAEAFAEGWRWSRLAFPHPLSPSLAAHCAVVHALGEDHARAESWVDRGGVLHERAGLAAASASPTAASLARALIAIGRLDRTGAEEALLGIDRGVGSSDLWWVVEHAHARVALLWGDRRQALADLDDALDSAPSLTPPTAFAGAVLRADAADLHHSQGELGAATRCIQALDRWSGHPVVAPSTVRAHIVVGHTVDAEALMARYGESREGLLAGTARHAVQRANLAHLMRRADQTAAVDAAVDAIRRTRAFDAAFEAIPAVHRGIVERLALPGERTARFVSVPTAALTARELQVLGLLAAHASVREIAAAMHVSRNTTKTHLRMVYRKLGVSTRAAALEVADRLKPRDDRGDLSPREG